jgi:hypothetical protein
MTPLAILLGYAYRPEVHVAEDDPNEADEGHAEAMENQDDYIELQVLNDPRPIDEYSIDLAENSDYSDANDREIV